MIIGFTIEDIRARHQRVAEAWATPVDDEADRAHIDRGVLLAEVDRLTRERDEARAEVERLRAEMREIRERLHLATGHSATAALLFEEAHRKTLEAKP